MALGTDHARREGLRARLKTVRLSCPLFDTDTWVRRAGFTFTLHVASQGVRDLCHMCPQRHEPAGCESVQC